MLGPTSRTLRHAGAASRAQPGEHPRWRTQEHRGAYDLSDEMFAAFLDPSLSYLLRRARVPRRTTGSGAGRPRGGTAARGRCDPRPGRGDRGHPGARDRHRLGTLVIRAAQRGAHVTTLTISRRAGGVGAGAGRRGRRRAHVAVGRAARHRDRSGAKVRRNRRSKMIEAVGRSTGRRTSPYRSTHFCPRRQGPLRRS